jgi:TonB family protein
MKQKILNLKLLLLITGSLLIGADLSWAQGSEEEIDTLEVIEIPGTAVILEDRQLTFPEPNFFDFPPFPISETLRISAEFNLNHNFNMTSVVLDPIGQRRSIKSKPIPMKINRPPYPRIAKEQGWEGTVKLILTIGSDGKVSSATIHSSSGFPLLDQIALDATKDWLFEPEKDGEFPVETKVNVPIQFSLHENK